MGLRDRVLDRFFGDLVERRVQNAVKVIDDSWWSQIGGAVGPHDRNWGDMQESLSDSLEAWRTNPLARRIVALTTDYVVGDGLLVKSERSEVQAFIDAFWSHPFNKLAGRLYAWCDELSRSGEIFVVVSTNPGDGMSYVRSIPASRVDRIETSADDLEQELRYHELLEENVEGRWWPGVVLPLLEFEPFVLHYAVNRPIGAIRGEGDLGAILTWLRRYREWLEDRVRVNRLRNSFVWHVRMSNAQPGDVERKRKQYATTPSPGSMIVTDENEEWEALSASLQSSDAEADGKALRLMVAAGAGIPLHFLSEGESATKATAAEMGGPTFRHYKHRQLAFADMLMDLVTVCARQYGLVGDLKLSVTLPDLSREDNLQLAQAMREVGEALGIMVDREWIDGEAAKRLAVKFCGEVG